MATEIVDLPINHGDFPVRHVSLPEGTWDWRTDKKNSPSYREKTDSKSRILTIHQWELACNVGKTILNHPPVITINFPIGGMVAIPKWVIYAIVLPTL